MWPSFMDNNVNYIGVPYLVYRMDKYKYICGNKTMFDDMWYLKLELWYAFYEDFQNTDAGYI